MFSSSIWQKKQAVGSLCLWSDSLVFTQWMMRSDVRSDEVWMDVPNIVDKIRACGFRGDGIRKGQLYIQCGISDVHRRYRVLFHLLFG